MSSYRCHGVRAAGAALVLCLVSPAGCKKKDPEKCTNAQNTVRQAIAGEDFASARQWREYAYKNCDDKTQLDALDKEIVDKEAAMQKRKTDEEAAKRKTDDLVKLFVDWVAQHKANPVGAAVTVNCVGEETPKQERWCTRERTAGDTQLKVDYWEGEPDVFHFSSVAPGPVTCETLGPGSTLKNAHDGALLHCSFSGGPLAGLQALITRTAAGTLLSVVSEKYIERHAGFRARLAK
jgi:hypothetical protein